MPDNNTSTQQGNLVNVTGLWLHTSKTKGTQYMSGSFGMCRVYIFKNKSKRKDSDPDYYMALGNPTRKDHAPLQNEEPPLTDPNTGEVTAHDGGTY